MKHRPHRSPSVETPNSLPASGDLHLQEMQAPGSRSDFGLGGCGGLSVGEPTTAHLAPLARPDLPGRLGQRRCWVAGCLRRKAPDCARYPRHTAGVRCSTPRLDIYYVFDPDIFDERCVPCSAALAPDWVPPCGPVSQIPAQGHNP